jgi:hypothetical protein
MSYGRQCTRSHEQARSLVATARPSTAARNDLATIFWQPFFAFALGIVATVALQLFV